MDLTHRSREAGSQSVFRTILVSLLVLLVVETFLLVGSLAISGVSRELDQNARDILHKQVENRANYLENAMVTSWSDLTLLSETINTATLARMEQGLTLDQLNGSSDACAPLLLDVADELITTLYAKQASGIFVVFNTKDLSSDHFRGRYENKTGIYIRDMDPVTTPPNRGGDLLLERAPIAVVEAMNIATDSGWHPLFTFGDLNQGYYDFLYQPFQAAYRSGLVKTPSDFGYWSATPYSIQGSNLSAISYSIPLILPDGTVYGVVGVELLSSYLRTLLPMEELYENNKGSYLLAVSRKDLDGADAALLAPVMTSGLLQRDLSEETFLEITPADGGYECTVDKETNYASVVPLNLYSNNAPFEDQHWALIGVVPTRSLYAFSGKVNALLLLALVCNLAAGIVGSVVISRRLSRPIQVLSREVAQAQKGKGEIPKLSTTGLREIDQFAGAITTLSRDVVAASTRFLQIMDMASVELGGFEIREKENTVFITDNFFPLFGLTGLDTSAMTVTEFRHLMDQIDSRLERLPGLGDSILYQVPLEREEVRYVRVEVTSEGDRQVGLAEDVTAATQERLRIEHDRDYDLLTGLLNRRAFHRLAEALFADPNKMRQAALVMLDLDNLKTTNDRYGHDWGDQYIRQAGQCFAAAVPAGSLCARVSGDEFTILLWGFDSREEGRKALNQLSQAIRNSNFRLPNGDMSRIRASGGVAWFPGDGRELPELMKLADFAMYQVKQTQKGRLEEFDLGSYNHESYLLQCRREIHQLLEDAKFTYAFQPIVDTITGEIRAYEALLRVNMPTIKSPDAVLAMAKDEGQLQKMETLSLFKSAECYQSLLEQGKVLSNAYLFVNSIAGQCMTHEDMVKFHQLFHSIQDRIVVEITESEAMDKEATRRKREAIGFSGLFALDDYGSGYNSEKNLLELSPAFIKVDISIIHDIDSDADKQKIVSNVVEYAHERGMLIIAEGLETAQEVAKVLELGVDLLQGYFLAKPNPIPGEVNPEALALIRAHGVGQQRVWTGPVIQRR